MPKTIHDTEESTTFSSSDGIECPWCHEEITLDLEDYEPENTTETDCPFCENLITLYPEVSVSYTCEKGWKEKEYKMSKSTNVNDRVGAVQKEENRIVYLYGYGTYLGRKEAPCGPFGTSLQEWYESCDRYGLDRKKFENPCILLDSGEVV